MRRLLARLVVPSCVVLALGPGAPTAAGAQEAAAEGKRALRSGDYEAARGRFEEGVRDAEEKSDSGELGRYYFYRGLTDQLEGEKLDDEALLRSAAGHYEKARELLPESGSTLVNLAQVRQSLGETRAAERLFRAAIRLEDEKQASYLEAYGDFLAEQGGAARASSVFQQALEVEPGNARIENKLFDALRAAEAEDDAAPQIGGGASTPRRVRTADFLWDLLRRGEVLRAQEYALRALEEGEEGESGEEMLTIVLASLTSHYPDPAAFESSAVEKRLRALSADAGIGEGALELAKSYGPALCAEAAGWSWWTAEERREPRSERAVAAHEALGRALLVRGEWYKQQEEYASAERCYELAVELDREGPDPAALRQLVDLYALQGDDQRLEGVANRYVFELFQGKGEAYREGQAEEIYEYHATLGRIYGYLADRRGSDWGDSSTVNSAIFQLERARDFGRELEAESAQSAEPSRRRFSLDPGVVDLLARGYTAKYGEEKGIEERLTAAERYEAVGNARARDIVLEPIAAQEIEDERQLQRYEVMKPEARLPDSRSGAIVGTSAGTTSSLAAGVALRGQAVTSSLPEAQWDRQTRKTVERMNRAVGRASTPYLNVRVAPGEPGALATLRRPDALKRIPLRVAATGYVGGTITLRLVLPTSGHTGDEDRNSEPDYFRYAREDEAMVWVRYVDKVKPDRKPAGSRDTLARYDTRTPSNGGDVVILARGLHNPERQESRYRQSPFHLARVVDVEVPLEPDKVAVVMFDGNSLEPGADVRGFPAGRILEIWP